MRSAAAALLLLAASGLAAPAQGPPGRPEPEAPFTVQAVGTEDLQRVIAARKGKVVILNFWATWCGPCRVEFPDLVRIARENPATVALVTVSLDDPEEAEGPVREFLERMEAPGARLIKKAGDPDPFIRSVDPDWSGVLPATFIHRADGSRAHAVHGPVTYEMLEEMVTPLLPRR